MADPASIRTNNPGAQWLGPIARQYGATGAESLPGGNNAAVFPDPVSGAAAQFALWGKNYAGMPLSAAISKWSGGNSPAGYTDFITKATGLAPDTVLTPETLAGPQGLALAKAQAQWEAGKPYPMTDAQWAEAQSRGLGGTPPQAPAPQPSAPMGANAMGQAQAAPQPYFPTPAQWQAGRSPTDQSASLGNPMAAYAAPPPLQAPPLPPAWHPQVPLPPNTLGTLRQPFFSRG